MSCLLYNISCLLYSVQHVQLAAQCTATPCDMKPNLTSVIAHHVVVLDVQPLLLAVQSQVLLLICSTVQPLPPVSYAQFQMKKLEN